MMREDAWKTYESWRRLWLSGGDSNDIAALTDHYQRVAQVPVATREDNRTVGRNEPCPCGTGRKYKHCCGAH